MQNNNKILDDLARMASGAAGSLMDVKREVEQAIAYRLEKHIQNMELASREELDAAQAMIRALRQEQEALKKRIETLENQLISK